MAARDVSVVIPVLNAEPYLPALLAAFARQQPTPPREVIVVDSQSTDRTAMLAAAGGARVVPITNFSHGGARNLGAREARGELVVFLSQDACPQDEHWLAELLKPFDDPLVAAAFSRQVPRPEATPTEAFFHATHFPDGDPVRRELGRRQALEFRDVFFSNVSAAIRRAVLIRHPFDESLIMSEDQQFARDVLRAGYATVYQPTSRVVHSHDYGLVDVFRRYFDSCYSLTQIFPTHDHKASADIGLRYVARATRHIARHHPLWLPRHLGHVAASALGTLAGHHAERLPRRVARAFSLHRYYWR